MAAVFPLILVLIAGLGLAIQPPTNAALAKASGSVVLAALTSFLIGTVVLAKDLYFTGNTVIVDHGAGLGLAAHDGARDLGRGRGLRCHVRRTRIHGLNTGAGVSSSSRSTASRGAAIASERSTLTITLARYSGAIGRPKCPT